MAETKISTVGKIALVGAGAAAFAAGAYFAYKYFIDDDDDNICVNAVRSTVDKIKDKVACVAGVDFCCAGCDEEDFLEDSDFEAAEGEIPE